ncbi:MAG: hypothetical protein H5T62_14060 [Anaerolineae bacterium]|nr:hypothetical protein [Anaerolineae bacterium]
MFRTKKLTLLALVVMIAPMVLAGCGPTPEPQTVVQTVEVEKIVVQTVEVVKTVEVVVTATPEPDPEDAALAFDPESGTRLTVMLDGEPLGITKYLVTYVANPVRMADELPGRDGTMQPVEDVYAWQKMYIYVPDTSADDQDTAIILRVNNGGWMNSPVSDIVEEGAEFVSDSDNDAIGAALKAGYIIVNAGTRSRGLVAADGTYPGHAPAVVVDAKAAIRYLKLNDEVMPGSADRIVITGVSGGGGLSVAVAASGNSPDYYPYLEEIGAAGIDADGNSTLTDDVFATIAYCPITDLDHADIAYEWQYSATRLLGDYTDGQLSDQMKQVSADLAALYPAYLESLGLVLEDGTPLTADTMPDAIVALVKADIEKAMAKEDETIPDLGETWTFTQRDGSELAVINDWLDVDNDTDTVVSIDYGKYLEFVATTAKLKTAPAFDNYGTPLQYRMNESNLAGDEMTEYSHWLEWSWENDAISDNKVGLDDTGLTFDEFMATDAGKAVMKQMKMINPMPYLTSDEGDSAPYWYVRHGMRDRDTSFAVEVALFYAIQNDPAVQDANFAIAYMQPHGGNYDVQEAYSWLAGVLAAAE